MPGSQVPQDVKLNVRAVLMSQIGGVLVSDFRKDYKKLINQKLFIENYGFKNYKEFIESMPEFARLEYSDKDMAYRLFAVPAPNMYMSLAAKKAVGNYQRGNRAQDRNPSRPPEHNSTLNNNDESKRLVPNSRGLYTVCFPIENARSTEKDDVLELFSQAGEVGEVHTTTKWIFVRFKTEQGALSSLDKLSNLDVRIADEGKSRQRVDDRPIAPVTEDESDSFLVNKFSSAREKSAPQTEAPAVKMGVPRSGKENEVFVGNIANTVTDEEFEEYITNLNCSYCRLVRKDLKLYAFLGFNNLTAAHEAVSVLDGVTIKGRRIQARIANPNQNSQNSPPQNYNAQKTEVSPPSNNQSGFGRGGLMHMFMAGGNKMDKMDHTPTGRPGLLGSGPPTLNSAGDASNSLLNRSFESNQSVSSGSVRLADRMTDLSISIDRSGKKVITSTPISRSSASPSQAPLTSPRTNPDPEDEMPPLEESMPNLEESGLELSEPDDDNHPVQLFVANFSMSTTARELFSLFFNYKVMEVKILPLNKCPKAYVTLPNIAMAEACLRDLNQVEYMGRPLLVDIPREHPHIKEKMLARSSYKGGNPTPPMVASTRPRRSAMLEDLCAESVDVVSGSSDSGRNVADILDIYAHILDKTKARKNYLAKGRCVQVLVTAAEEENFFWGQVVSEKREKQIALKHLVKDLQDRENHLAKTKGLGRCAAIYDGEWHRAWILKASMEAKDYAKVFFVDYGNVEKVTFQETCVVGPRFWVLPPLVMPFRVAGPGLPNLGDLENKVVECEVIQTTPEGRAMLTEVFIDEQDFDQQSAF